MTDDGRYAKPAATTKSYPNSWVALGAAALLFLVANGRHTIAIAPWLAMFSLLYFVRSKRPRAGLPLAWLLLFLEFAFQFRGMAPVPGIFYYVLSAVYGFALFLPFAIDRLVVPRAPGFANTLVFPCAWVAMEWFVAGFTPYGSWGSLAYTQHENLVLLQLLAATGLYGPSFLIAWFASVATQMTQRGFSDRTAQRTALVFVAVGTTILLAGGARLVFFAPDSPTVRIASLTKPDVDLFSGVQGGIAAAFSGQLSEQNINRIRDNGNTILDDLLQHAGREAEAGARIVFWGETNSFSMKADEPAMMARGAQFARDHGIFLGMAPAVFGGRADKPLENKLVLFNPDGDVALEYWKAIPVPGSEADVQAKKGGRIETTDTPYGRIGAAICFDMDFPDHLKQAGRRRADIMLVPSNDWREIDPWHSQMARFRAIEQGFNLVRHASNGLSLAADYQGRILASMDHFTSDTRDLVAMVPTRGCRTIYSRIGDLFAWLCIAGLAVMVVLAGKVILPQKRGTIDATPYQ